MSSRAGTDKKLLLDLLNQWSIRHDLSSDPYLNSIAKTVASDAPLDLWSELDPEVHLPRPMSQEGASYIRASRIIAIFRNALVFIPVALTWKAVSEATTAFSEFVGTNNATPVNFLEFWQNGFGVLSPRWKIGTIAEIDFWLIIAIVIATVLTSLLSQYGRNRDARVQIELDKEREVVVFEIKSYLFTPNSTSITAIDSSLRKALRNLNAAAQSISTAAARLEKSLTTQSRSIVESQAVARETKNFQKLILKTLKKNS